MKFKMTVLLAAAIAFGSVASAADIVDTAVAGHFDTLVAAVKAAGLVDTLKGSGLLRFSRPPTQPSRNCLRGRWKPF